MTYAALMKYVVRLASLCITIHLMAKVTIHQRDGRTVEISDLTFEQVKELAGVNGYSHAARSRKRNIVKHNEELDVYVENSAQDVHGFLSHLSDRGRDFIKALRDNPNGVEANSLAGLLKLNDARQIGGFTGGGLAKLAKQYKVRMHEIYKSNVSFPNGKRTRTFYPGKLIKKGIL